MESKFTISEVLKTSWKATKSQIWILVGLVVAYTIIQGILTSIGEPIYNPNTQQLNITTTSCIIWVISFIVSLLFELGYIKNCFQALDDYEPQFSAYGIQAKKIVTYFIAYIIFCIVIIIGVILFIVPGVYLALRLQFFAAAIVEENAGIIESFQKSWEITKGSSLKLFLTALASLLIILIGFILLFIGVFVALPLCVVIYCYLYRKLNVYVPQEDTSLA